MTKLFALVAVLCVSSIALAKPGPVRGTGTGWKNGKVDYNYIGFKIDVGAPDGLGLSLTGRPLKFLQLEFGGTTTLVGGGVRGGATIFLPYYVSPSLTIEGGRQWGGDFNKLVVMFGGSNPKISLLNDVQYDYMNLHGGLGFGHPNWFMFRINAGYSYIVGTTNGLQAFVQSKAQDGSLRTSEANGKVWSPSAKITFQFYF